jgi:hypothetical protein
MNKFKFIIFFVTLILSSASFGATLHSLNKKQVGRSFINKTAESIATDNLNGRTINNTFSMFLDSHGNAWGKMSLKPKNEPQRDKGTYSIKNDGTFYITWQHWDGAKKLCAHFFDTKNAYIAVSCHQLFHTVFMKHSMHPGNHLN